jgi:hypothetical protein
MHPWLHTRWCRFGWELTKSIGSFEQNYFTAKEFDAILNHLAKGTVFEKAKTDKTEVYKTAIDPIKMLSHVM